MNALFARATLGLLAALACHVASADADTAWYQRWWNSAVDETTSIARDGAWDLYLPGKIYHLPIAYTAEQRNRYNESPMPAFGIGRGQYLANGNWQGLYGMGFKDSNEKTSWMLGYAYRWLWDSERLPGLYYGLGATVFLMSRQDYLGYIPFPAALPTASIGYRNFALETAFVPGAQGNGNVFFIWLKLEEKGRPVR